MSLAVPNNAPSSELVTVGVNSPDLAVVSQSERPSFSQLTEQLRQSSLPSQEKIGEQWKSFFVSRRDEAKQALSIERIPLKEKLLLFGESLQPFTNAVQEIFADYNHIQIVRERLSQFGRYQIAEPSDRFQQLITDHLISLEKSSKSKLGPMQQFEEIKLFFDRVAQRVGGQIALEERRLAISVSAVACVEINYSSLQQLQSDLLSSFSHCARAIRQIALIKRAVTILKREMSEWGDEPHQVSIEKIRLAATQLEKSYQNLYDSIVGPQIEAPRDKILMAHLPYEEPELPSPEYRFTSGYRDLYLSLCHQLDLDQLTDVDSPEYGVYLTQLRDQRLSQFLVKNSWEELTAAMQSLSATEREPEILERAIVNLEKCGQEIRNRLVKQEETFQSDYSLSSEVAAKLLALRPERAERIKLREVLEGHRPLLAVLQKKEILLPEAILGQDSQIAQYLASLSSLIKLSIEVSPLCHEYVYRKVRQADSIRDLHALLREVEQAQAKSTKCEEIENPILTDLLKNSLSGSMVDIGSPHSLTTASKVLIFGFCPLENQKFSVKNEKTFAHIRKNATRFVDRELSGDQFEKIIEGLVASEVLEYREGEAGSLPSRLYRLVDRPGSLGEIVVSQLLMLRSQQSFIDAASTLGAIR